MRLFILKLIQIVMKTIKLIIILLICFVYYSCNNNAGTKEQNNVETLSNNEKTEAGLKLVKYIKFDQETKSFLLDISQEEADSLLGISKEMYEFHLKELHNSNEFIHEAIQSGEEIQFDSLLNNLFIK